MLRLRTNQYSKKTIGRNIANSIELKTIKNAGCYLPRTAVVGNLRGYKSRPRKSERSRPVLILFSEISYVSVRIKQIVNEFVYV